tara:strand:+ start:72 stop:2411 length:2340 start_codon:yes stop_codon:yes gene_type:complete
MAKQLKLRRGTTSQHSSFTGAEGEVTVDTDKESLVVHNGSTAGGFAIARADSPDNQKTRWGTGNDLSIYHNSTNSYIENDNGNLIIDNGSGVDMYLNSGNDIYIRPQGSENGIKLIGNGAVEAYYDNTKRFETTSTGATITPDLILNGSGDTALRWAVSGTNKWSIYNNSAGGNVLTIFDNNGSGTAAKFNTNGAVEAYYDNTKRFETVSDGIRWTGHCYANDNYKLRLGSSSDLQLFHDGSNNYMRGYTAGQGLYIDNLQDIRIRAGDNAGGYQNSIYMDNNGGVHCYYDNSKKFETKSNGAEVHGNFYADGLFAVGSGCPGVHIGSTNAGGAAIYFDGDSNGDFAGSDYSYIWHGTDGDLAIHCDCPAGDSQFELYVGSGATTAIIAQAAGEVQLYHNGTQKLATKSNGVTVTGNIYTDGNVNLTADDKKLRFGAGEDLQVWHSGSHSYISNKTGNLYIRNETADWIYIRPKSDEDGVIVKEGGNVELYFDNTLRFATNSSGVEVNGHIWLGDGEHLKCGAGTNGDLRIYHDGHSIILDNNAAATLIASNEIQFTNKLMSETTLKITENGSVGLYYDNSKKFETKSTGLKMWGDGTGDGLFEHDNTTGNNNRYFEIRNARSGNGRGRTGGIWIGENSNSQGDIMVRSGGGNADISGGVRISNGSSSWSTVSDMRLKDKTGDITNALVDIAKIEPIKFTWKSDANKTPQVGVSAQSVENVVPEAISKNREQDLEKQGDTTEYMGVRYTELVPLCIAALKEAKVKIETLETKVAALEAG